MKTIAFTIAAASTLLFTSCKEAGEQADVTFAKSTFASLVRGDSAVATDIDWETFTSLGIPVGTQYLAITTEPERQSFKTGFITQFSASFRDSGGSIDSFSNWRATSLDEINTTVTADSANGSVRLTVSERNSQKRLSALEILK